MKNSVVVFGKLGCVALLGLLALPVSLSVSSPVNAMRGEADMSRANFNEIDKNGDGVITRNEYEAHRRQNLGRRGSESDKDLNRGNGKPRGVERERGARRERDTQRERGTQRRR